MASRKEPRRPSQRPLRVGEEMRHAFVQLLASGEIHDPDLSGTMLTVTEVRMSPDLRNANIFFVPLGGEGGPQVLKALKRATPFIRRRLAEAVQLRVAPQLWFELDTSFESANRIETVLKDPQVRRDLD
ncbi:MAG: 30S ribosome-binding factor RbfA [Rhodospirillaceae bacterium]|nr:30S ribosome-binding factor RbfA [Rhodospirillaceae bacterium]